MIITDADRERFWRNVDLEGPVHKTLGTRCHVWSGTRTWQGYGQFWLDKEPNKQGFPGKNVKAHRVAWELVNGTPEGVGVVMHKCDNPWCVNVKEHLEWGNQSWNTKDMVARGRAHVEKINAEKQKLSKSDVETIRRRVQAGETQAHLAREFNVSEGYVCKLMQQKKGEKAWRELTEHDVEQARKRLTAGETISALARELKVSRSHLSNVLAGRRKAAA
jgi:DNA-binding transcriptional regulator YiaG